MHRFSLLLLTVFFLPLSAQNPLPKYISSILPAQNAANVGTNSRIAVRYSNPVNQYDVKYALRPATAGTPIELTVEALGIDHVLAPKQLLTPNTRYRLSITPIPAIGQPFDHEFSSGPRADTSGPSTVAVAPASGTKAVNIYGPFTIEFSEPVVHSFEAQIPNAISLQGAAGQTIRSSFSVSADGRTVRLFNINENPQFAVIRLVADPSKLRDLAGNPGTGEPVVATYYTAFSPSDPAPLLAHYPAQGDENVPTNVSLRALFGRPLDPSSFGDKPVPLVCDGQAISLAYNISDSNRTLAGRADRLLPQNAQCTWSIPASIREQSGLPIAPIELTFRTSSAPDLQPLKTEFVTPGYEQPSIVPRNAVLGFRMNNRIHPVSQALAAGLRAGYAVTHPASATLSADGRSLWVSPASAPNPAVQWMIGLPFIGYNDPLTDLTGAPVSYRFNTVSFSNEDDFFPPSIVSVSPPADTRDAPVSSRVSVRFSEPIGVPSTSDPVRLLRNGESVPALLSWSEGNRIATLIPTNPLTPAADYQVEIRDLTDIARNPLPPSLTSFRTAEQPVPPSPNVSFNKVTPHQDQTGVPIDTVIRFELTSSPAPLTPYVELAVLSPSDPQYPEEARLTRLAFHTELNGTDFLVIPDAPLPYAATIEVRISFPRIDGNSAWNPTIRFSTAEPPSGLPSFEVLSISPPAGSTLPTPAGILAVTFSEPVNPSSFAASNFTLSTEGRPSPPLLPLRFSSDFRTAYFHLTIALDGDTILYLSPQILSMDGRPLFPFSAQFNAVPDSAAGTRPSVLEVRPTYDSALPNDLRPLEPDSSVSIFFTAPIEPDLFRSSVVTLVDGATLPGDWNFSHSNQAATFRPTRRLSPGAVVEMFFQPEYQIDHLIRLRFLVAPAYPSSPLVVTRKFLGSNYYGAAPSGAIIEVELAQDIAPDPTLITLHANGGTPVPANIRKVRPRVLRISPLTTLAKGSYYLRFSDAFEPETANAFTWFSIDPKIEIRPPSILAFAPADRSTTIAANASISVVFDEVLNPLTLASSAIRVTAGDAVIPCQFVYLVDTNSARIIPSELLPPDSLIRVTIRGLEDRLGRVFPPLDWSFTTNSQLDFNPPVLVAATSPIEGLRSSTIPPNTKIRFVFDEPIDPGPVFDRRQSGYRFAVQVDSDLKAITFVPNSPLNRGEFFHTPSVTIRDLAGNDRQSVSAAFRVGFDPDTTPPVLLGHSPEAGAVSIPLNAVLALHFSEFVDAGSLRNARLSDGTADFPLHVQSRTEAILTLTPKRLLAPNTTYRLLIDSLDDMSSNPLAAPIDFSFTTGTAVDIVPPECNFSFPNYVPSNARFIVEYSEPIVPFSALGATQFGCRIGAVSGPTVPLPLDTIVAPDRLSAEIRPASPLQVNQSCVLKPGNAFDLAGLSCRNQPHSSDIRIVEEDNTPPTITLSPPDGATLSVISPTLQVGFSESISLPVDAPAHLRLFREGRPVQGSAGWKDYRITFTPTQPLERGATYRLEHPAVSDLAGNLSQPASSTFTIAPDALSRPKDVLYVVSSSPKANDAGVDPNAPLSFTFNLPLNPLVSPITDIGFQLAAAGELAYVKSGRNSVDGATVVLRPSQPLPAASTINTYFYPHTQSYYTAPSPTDLWGRRISYVPSFQFFTAASPDRTPPRILSITPDPGTPLRSKPTVFTLTFTKPLLLPHRGISVFSGTTQLYNPSVLLTGDPRVVLLDLGPPPSSQLTILGGSGVTDFDGNALEPFQFSWPTLASENEKLLSMSPRHFAQDVPPDTQITFTFSIPLSSASLPSGIRITENGENVTGFFSLSEDLRIVTFRPASPLRAGATIQVFVLSLLTDIDGYPMQSTYEYKFFIAGTPPTAAPPVVLSTSLADSGDPSRTALEIAFDQPIDPASVGDDSVWLRLDRRRIPGIATLRTPTVLRFVPDQPIPDDAQVILTAGAALRSAAGLPYDGRDFPFSRPSSDSLTNAEESLVAALEQTTFDGQPALRLRFTCAVSRHSRDSLRLLAADGAPVPYRWLESLSGNEWLLVLDHPAPGPLTLSLDRLEDASGRRAKPESLRVSETR